MKHVWFEARMIVVFWLLNMVVTVAPVEHPVGESLLVALNRWVKLTD